MLSQKKKVIYAKFTYKTKFNKIRNAIINDGYTSSSRGVDK